MLSPHSLTTFYGKHCDTFSISSLVYPVHACCLRKLNHTVHLPIMFVVHFCVAGSEKKGLIRTYRSCPALTHNKRINDTSDHGHMSKEILEKLSMLEQRTLYPDNTGKNRTSTVLYCTHCTHFLVL